VALYLEIAKQEQANYETSECSITNIVRMFDLSKATISHHLKELSNADLITTEKRGKDLVARINKETLGEVKQMLGEIKGD
jgi:DNA-binding transcriptional ArsR family regulator